MRSSAHAMLVCLAVAIAEIAWTYGTGFATAEVGLWIIASWALVAVFLAVAGHLLFPRPASNARVRVSLIVPPFMLALRGRHEIWGASGVLANVAILGGLIGLVVLATRRPTSLGRVWLVAVLCAATSVTRLASGSIEERTIRAVLSAHPGRATEVGLFALLICGLTMLAWICKWDGRSFSLYGLVPAMAVTGAFIARVAVLPPTSPRLVESAPNRPSIVILVLDTLRRDGLSALGGPPGLTPNLDRFASRSTLYTNAYSNGTYSLPSHASLFTGLLPSKHGAHLVGGGGEQAVDPTAPVVAEELREMGYSPYGYSANPVYLAQWAGLQRGFKSFYSDGRDRLGYYPTAVPMFRLARIRPLEQSWWPARDFLAAVEPIVSSQGTALFLNLMECHEPRPHFGHLDEKSAYWETVRELDRTLGGFLNLLDAQPNTMVVITSDHGEFLGEHGLSDHNSGRLYEPGLRIPLIIRFPGQREGRNDPRRITLMDVPPIVRAGIGGTPDSSAVPLPKEPRVIAETWTRLVESAAPFGGESPAARAIYLGRHKLIEHYDGSFELFDLVIDPEEKINLATKDPAFGMAMISLVQRTVPPIGNRPPTRPSAEVPPEVLERMRALGYLR